MEQIRQTFGDGLVAYCLNTSVDALDSTDFSPQQLEVIQDLTAVCQAIDSADPDPFSRAFALNVVLNYDASNHTSVANAWRQHCGGALVEVVSDDPVDEALLMLGRDFFPSSLLPRPADSTPFLLAPTLTVPVHHHPKTKELAQAILRDATLRKLFPGSPDPDSYDGDGVDVQSRLTWSSGGGGTYQLVLMPAFLLSSALNRLGPDPTPEEYLDRLRWALKASRSLANKKPTKVPVLVGLAHLNLVDGVSIAFKGGRIRLPTQGDRTNLMGAENVTAILEVEVPLRLETVHHWAPGPGVPANDPMNGYDQLLSNAEKFQQVLRRQIDLARLAMLFASPPDETIAPAEMAVAVMNPLASGQSASTSVYRYPVSAFGPAEISPSTAVNIQHWASRVAGHPSGLDMTMRRLLSSVSTRLDPMDGFVDAVICWENMFGTNQGEVTFRVCGAIAVLLEPDDAMARKTLFDELKVLYDVRSKLVHGTKEPKMSDAVAHRKRSVEIAIKALKGLYDRPELLTAGDSSVRGRLLLLGA